MNYEAVSKNLEKRFEPRDLTPAERRNLNEAVAGILGRKSEKPEESELSAMLSRKAEEARKRQEEMKKENPQ